MKSKLEKALKGKEEEFSLFMIEFLSYDNSMSQDMEYLFTNNKLDDMDKPQLLSIIKEYYKYTYAVYLIAHAFNKKHTCYKAHYDWRMKAFEIYKESVEAGLHKDMYNLLKDDIIEEWSAWYAKQAKKELVDDID